MGNIYMARAWKRGEKLTGQATHGNFGGWQNCVYFEWMVIYDDAFGKTHRIVHLKDWILLCVN